LVKENKKMSKKKIMIVGIIIIVLVVGFMVIRKNKRQDQNQNESQTQTSTGELNYSYDKETEEYVIYDENGDEKTRFKDKVLLHKYEDNPDFDPSMAPSGADMSEEIIDDMEE